MSKLRLGLLLCWLAILPAGCGQVDPLEDAGGEAPADTPAEQPVDAEAGTAEDGLEAVDASADASDEDVEAGADGAGTTRMASAPEGVVQADMLSEDEMARAEAMALESAALGQVVSQALDRDGLEADDSLSALSDLAEKPSYRVLYTQRYADKYATSRKAEVAVYRYDTGEVSISTVDLASGEVEALDVPEGYPVPLVQEEIDEAARIARADEAVRARLEAADLDPETAQANGIITVSREAGARCATARCLRLFFSSFEMPLPVFAVIVDLNDLAVVELEEMPWMGEEEGR